MLREPYVLAVPERLEGDDWQTLLREQPFIRYDRSSFGGRQVDRFLRSHAITPNESVEIDDIAALLALVGQGLGVALLPIVDGSPPLTSARAVSLAASTFYREIGILRSRDGNPASAYLADCLIGVRL
nr:LysR substrate-binding domain-containing protein [Rhizobium sp. RCAM05973]